MSTLTYAGIGARATPSSARADMAVIARWLARTRVPATGWHLASGGAKGADTAFAAGAPAGQRTIFLPWSGYNGHRGPDCLVLSASELHSCMEIAADLHPAWDRCSRTVRKCNRSLKPCWTELSAAVNSRDGSNLGRLRVPPHRWVGQFHGLAEQIPASCTQGTPP